MRSTRIKAALAAASAFVCAVAIAAVNHGPVITSKGPTTAVPGRAYTYDVDATDVDGDTLNYALLTPPAGARVDVVTGLITWTPGDAQVGTQALTVTVADGHGGVAIQTTRVEVVTANHAPVITSTAPTQARVGSVYTYDIIATDADTGDTLTYAFALQPADATIDGTKGRVRWTPTAAQLGSQSIGLVVRDNHGATATQAFVVTVLADNHVPRITSTPADTVALAATHVYDIVATDADSGDTLSYGLAQGPAGMSVDATSGRLTWTADLEPAGGQERQNAQCLRAPRPGVIDPVVLWHWEGSDVLPDYDQVMAAPVVARLRDSNGDGRIDALDHPNVVAITYKNDASLAQARGVIRVFDGVDGTELAHTSDADPVDGFVGAPALGDLDGDGRIEIAAVTYDNSLAAYAADGTLKWKRAIVTQQRQYSRGTVAIEDLDGDGHPEVIAAFNVFRGNGQPYWQLTDYRGFNNPVLGDVLAFADLGGDGQIEILAGGMAYRANGSILWANRDVGDGYDAVADVDGDGKPDWSSSAKATCGC